MLVHHQTCDANTTACGITEEKIANSELVVVTNDNWSKVNCGHCIRKYRRAHPRIHYQERFGSATPCGIMPSIRRPTQIVKQWLGVTCKECLATMVTAPKPAKHLTSTHSYRTRHPAWEGTLADVKSFMERYGRERAKALVKKYVRPTNAQTRVSNVPTGYWKTMRAEIDHWMRKPVDPPMREAAWGDLYFWRRDRPNKSWMWVQGRETAQSKFHGHTYDMGPSKWNWGSFHDGFGLKSYEHGKRAVGKSPLLVAPFASKIWWGTDYADLWKSCPMKYRGTVTGRWKSSDVYGGKLSENIYQQMAPRITGNRAEHIIIDDPIASSEVVRAMEKAWAMATRYGGAPDIMYASDAFMDAYRKDTEARRVLEGILNFNYKEMESRVNAAMTDALLYGSASYKIDNSESPLTVKENAMSNGISNPFARHFGFNPAEFVPARHGQPWDYESDARLIRFLKGGFTIGEIATELGRSEVSIECRVTFLAYKDERATLLAAGIAKLTAEPKTPRKAAKRKSKAKKGRK